MLAAVLTPRLVVAPLAAALAVCVGVLAGTSPLLAVAVVGVAVIVMLPFVAPVTHLTLLVIVAAVVPIDLQNRLATPLLPFDVLLLAGLAWAAVALLTRPMAARAAAALGLLALFLLLCGAQVAHGWLLGNNPSDVVNDMRNILGIAVFVVALPLISERAGRHRLFAGLIVVGLVVGLWGNAQWVLNIGSDLSREIGVAEGVALTTEGVGRVVGGRYTFGTIVVLAFAALLSPRRSSATTGLLLSILVLNTVALILAFERTLWLASALAVMIVVLGSESRRRGRAIVWGAMATLLVVAAMSALAPGQFSVARERLLSVGQYQSDISVRYRVRESMFVVREIRASPLLGSGLGASIYWGRPAEGVPPSNQTYAHNAYLWLAWKLGIPGLLLGLSLLGFVILRVWSCRRREPPDTVRDGAIAALLALLVTGATAPVFSTLSASVTIGILLALALTPPQGGGQRSDVRAAP